MRENELLTVARIWLNGNIDSDYEDTLLYYSEKEGKHSIGMCLLKKKAKDSYDKLLHCYDVYPDPSVAKMRLRCVGADIDNCIRRPRLS